MPRALTISRCRVPPELETEYLATLRRLARLSSLRGQRLWVFRSRAHPHLFLECSESGSVASHRTVAERHPEEQALERQLRTLAQYEPGAWDLWEELPLFSQPTED